ncbi:MAG: HlyD family secretion protein [Vicinamibacterales bacterium]
MSGGVTGGSGAVPARGRRAFLVLGALLLVVLGGLGVYAYLTGGQQDTDDAMVEADVVAVTARVSGLVAEILVRDNQTVKRGDPVLRLDDADLQVQLAQATAELETARAQAAAAHAQEQVVAATARGQLQGAQAQVSSSTASVQMAHAQLEAARAARARAQAEAQKAERDLVRAKELLAVDAIARQQMEAAQTAADAARAALSQAEANVTAAEEARRTAESRVVEAQARVSQTTPVAPQIETARSNAAMADARVSAAQAAVRQVELRLSYTTVVAPADGTVTQIGARQGALVQAGQPLAQLVPGRTYLVANFKETQIDAMQPGNRAEVHIDAYPGRSFDAVVESLAGGTGSRFSLIPPDNASGNFVKVVQRVPVRLTWRTDPEIPLKAGLSATVTVFTADR